MADRVVVCLSGGVVTPFGIGLSSNCTALCTRRTTLRKFGTVNGGSPYVASLFDRPALERQSGVDELSKNNYTFFERIAILAVKDALSKCPGLDLSRKDVLFILSTTKGNIVLLETDADDMRIYPDLTARRIAAYFDNKNLPLVVSNACISGVAAQVVAMRLLRLGAYRYAVVVGAEEQSRFIISGFQAFKALSEAPCRPYDKMRDGLNLGEAAAAMILTSKHADEVCAEDWVLSDGALRNDANHISGPSRTGEGSYRALMAVTAGKVPTDWACISSHGTATLYNDEMEAIAIGRAGLSEVPVNSLKGFFGHTMGAAGVLEPLLTMHSLGEEGGVLPTAGFNDLGVSVPLHVTKEFLPMRQRSFVKLMSGFGGCNAALAYDKGFCGSVRHTRTASVPYRVKRLVTITSDGLVQVDGTNKRYVEKGCALLTAIYRREINDYPKFFKMDTLCRLGFVASELLLTGENTRFVPRSDRAVIVFGKSGSLCTDFRHQATLAPTAGFPSPAVFVYTLANIVTGEIAIRNKYYGETSSYLIGNEAESLIREVVAATFMDIEVKSAICAWLECGISGNFVARMGLLEREDIPQKSKLH